MSFHRKAFLVWLILMISVGAIAIVGAHLDPVPDEIKRSGMEQLIEAAAAHAKPYGTAPLWQTITAPEPPRRRQSDGNIWQTAARVALALRPTTFPSPRSPPAV